MKRHHLEGRWCGSNFRVVKWHNLEERRCSLDLQGTRRCPQEISDAKRTLETWEDVHRIGAMPWRLHSQFFATVIFYHNDLWASCSEQLINLKQCPSIKGISKAYWWPLEKNFQAKLAILLLFMWLNLVKSTKLPMYPRKGSSHYVIQKILIFFLMIFIVLFCFLWHKKGGLMCVILAHAPQYFKLYNSRYHH